MNQKKELLNKNLNKFKKTNFHKFDCLISPSQRLYAVDFPESIDRKQLRWYNWKDNI